MKLGDAATVFAAYGAWRAVGSARAGQALARALASTDETSRTAAGMLLVRAGARSLPLLRDNLRRGTAVPMTLRILGDIGGSEATESIRRYLDDPDPAIARAAGDALQAATPQR